MFCSTPTNSLMALNGRERLLRPCAWFFRYLGYGALGKIYSFPLERNRITQPENRECPKKGHALPVIGGRRGRFD